MRTVLAQGTFDILHPGHIHYLEKSKELGDRLVVVISRDSRIKNKKNTYFDEDERKELISSLEMVDEAILGVKGDIYKTVEKVDPDVITLGYDQPHKISEVKELAEDSTGHEVKVERIDSKKNYSSSDIRKDPKLDE